MIEEEMSQHEQNNTNRSSSDVEKGCTLMRILVTLAAITGFVLVLQAVIRADQEGYAALDGPVAVGGE